jgi:hypothetical protein
VFRTVAATSVLADNTGQPDPALAKALRDAQAQAGLTHRAARAARAKADAAATAARIAASGARDDEAAFRQALARAQALGPPLQEAANALGAAQHATPPDPALIAQLQADLDNKQAAQNHAADISIQLQKAANLSAEQAQEKADQARMADAFATNAEGTAKQADQNAKDAQAKLGHAIPPATPPGGGANPGQPFGKAAHAAHGASAGQPVDNGDDGADPDQQGQNDQ